MEPWPEGNWVEVGDFVRMPKWGGDRWEVTMNDEETALFSIFNDHEVIAKGDGSKAEAMSKSVKVDIKFLNSLNPSDLFTDYMLLKVKEYLNLK